ncbi:permease [Campylobacterota bacterium]|nr:permease [Campylobacterota bacterium]
MVLLVAMAIMNGFDKEFREKLFVMNYPITILPRFGDTLHIDTLHALAAQFPHLKFSPYLQAGAMSRHKNQMEGNIVFGVDFDAEKAVNPVFAKAINSDHYQPFEAIAGKALKDKFMLNNGDKLLLIFTKAEPIGLALTPVMKRFTVADTFSSGLNAYDKAYFYTQIDDLRQLLRVDENSIHGIHIFTDEPFKDIEALSGALSGDIYAIGWWEQNANFFSALELEKRALFLVLMLIILVAALNIISSLLMTVLNRRKEIALLLSLGASSKEIEKIFFVLGCLIGAGGIVLGLLLGGTLLWILGNFDIISLPADVYGTAHLPLELSLTDMALTILGAFIIVLVSSWYPAKKASQTDALDTLRHE